ncbi:hypothetical protein [Glutamicibacter arilaitensis]|uniref:hypothetical protein n=1 Tax=Glutamicibacter arilaitensis TaxID=256701 RepID=UPI003FD42F39
MKVKSLPVISLCALALVASLSVAPANATSATLSPPTDTASLVTGNAEEIFPPAPEVKLSTTEGLDLDGSGISITSKQLLDANEKQALSTRAKQSLRAAAPAADEVNKGFTLVQEDANAPVANLVVETATDSDLILQSDDTIFIQGSSETQQYGVIEKPVGIDAKGKKVELVTAVDGSKVSYTVADPAKAVFPVATAAAWSYTVAYTWKDVGWPAYVSFKKAAAALKKCFNCSFPLSGAPKAFPVKGQKINLRVMGYKAPVQVTKASKSPVTWTFKTLPGHFDGTGSTIQFNLFSGRNNEFALGVTAKVTSSKIPQWLNKNASKKTWKTFAYRIAREANR